jgi:hypothetical protein
MMLFANRSKRLAALRAMVLLLFLPAHVAFVLLIDLDFIPRGGGSLSVQDKQDHGPSKERLRLHLLRPAEQRVAAMDDVKVVVRDLDPWTLPPSFRPVPSAGESVSTTLTKPASIRIWLAATPQNHRAPPA